MTKPHDPSQHIGMRYGDLTVERYVGQRAKYRHSYQTRCVCGNTAIVDIYKLTGRQTQRCRSCATGLRTKLVEGVPSDQHPLYATWLHMRARCSKVKHQDYYLYGGRGIRVCPRWEASFTNFVNDMGPRPPGMTLDRIDVAQDYGPSNCRWATPQMQSANRRPFSEWRTQAVRDALGLD